MKCSKYFCIIKIYTCYASGTNIGKPIISNWHQINSDAPTNSVIKKYLPQTSSGTYSFFKSKLLNGNTPDANCDASHLSTFLEEHDARGVTLASKPNAIYAFDWSRWNAEGSGVEPNLRNISTMGKLGVLAADRIAPSATTVNTDSAHPHTHFLGTRYIYNVVELASHPAGYTNQKADVEALIGVRPTPLGSGYICAGAAAKAIALAGFVPLALAATGGTGLPTSHCRLNPNPL